MDESTLQLDRMVVINSHHGEKYIGWVPAEIEDAKKYVVECCKSGTPAELVEVRLLVSNLMVQPVGGEQVVLNQMFLMPVDMFPAATERLFVRISSFYFPADNEECKEPVEKMMEDARKMDARRAALDAGIEIAAPRVRQ